MIYHAAVLCAEARPFQADNAGIVLSHRKHLITYVLVTFKVYEWFLKQLIKYTGLQLNRQIALHKLN